MDFLEPEFAEPYKAWQTAGGTPEANAAFLGHIEPVIGKAIKTHVGAPNPLLTSRARRMALDAVRGYDPTKSRLQTHLFNQLQGLKRVNRQQTQVLKVPERVSLDRYNLAESESELAHVLGREPTDGELADHTGFSLKRIQHVRTFNPAVAEGTMDAATESTGAMGGIMPQGGNNMHVVHSLVYDDLSPFDQKVMEFGLGMNGRRPLPNQEIAFKLNRSPGYISQRKKIIQELIDRTMDLNPL